MPNTDDIPKLTLEGFLDFTVETGVMKKRAALLSRFNDLSKELFKKSRPRLKIYRVESSFIFQFKIPSETHTGKLWYDVVIRFDKPDEDKKDSEYNVINDYHMTFISNMPSFTYNYAYISNQRGWIIEEMKHILPDIFFEQEPKVKNKSQTFEFEKSITLACLLIAQRKLNFKRALPRRNRGDVFAWRRVNRSINTFDELQRRRKKLDSSVKKSKRRSRRQETRQRNIATQKAHAERQREKESPGIDSMVSDTDNQSLKEALDRVIKGRR